MKIIITFIDNYYTLNRMIMLRFHLFYLVCLLCFQGCFYSTKTSTKYVTTARAVPVQPPQVAALEHKGDLSIANNIHFWNRTFGLSLGGNYALTNHIYVQGSGMYFTDMGFDFEDIERTEFSNSGGAINLALGYYKISDEGNLFETSLGVGYRFEKFNIEQSDSTGISGQNNIITPYGSNALQLTHKIYYGIGGGVVQFGIGLQTNLINYQSRNIAAIEYRIDSYSSVFGNYKLRYLEDLKFVNSQLLLQPFYNISFRFTERFHLVLQSSLDILTYTPYKSKTRLNGGITMVYYPIVNKSKEKEFDF